MIVSGFKIPIEFLVDAYIYEITHGFREICTVKVSLPEIDLAKELNDYSNSQGVGCILVDDNFRDIDSYTILETHYSLMLFEESQFQNAMRLKKLLEKPVKSELDHIKIGKYFGYKQQDIEDFVKRYRNHQAQNEQM